MKRKMTSCYNCGKEIQGIRKYFTPFCTIECENDYNTNREEKKNEIKYERLAKTYLKKENKSDDIQIKYMKLEDLGDEQSMLLKLINEWKRMQGPELQIINIETWHTTAYYANMCEPWTTKIIYTFKI
jgi:endogenous inhibitor of DNA gyrase (YacG/DUF329 family)